jgi:prepilin-type N-terminal cleavage/methylation domain-containing protein
MRNNKGFNLVELLIVIAIMGILAGIAAPNLTNLVRKNRIENSTRKIYSDLMNARVMAMDRNMMHFFRFTSANSYGVFADTSITGANFGTWDAGDTRVIQRSGPDNVPFTFSGVVPANENVGGAQVSFNGRGIANQQGTVCIGDATMITQPSVNCVVVGMTRIRMGQISTANIAAGNCAGNCNAIQ